MKVIPPIRTSSFVISPSMLTAATANGIALAEPAVGEVSWTSGATFALGDKAILGAPSSTVTITNAAPAAVSWSGNGLPNGTVGQLTTSGTLPAGLSIGVDYYVVNRAAATFQLSTDPDGAPITTTSAGSGTHTFTAQVHRAYESLTAGNTGNPPAIDDGTHWLDVGPTNKWAMFDLDRGTQTIGASPLVVTLTPGERVDAIGAVGLVGDSIRFQVSSVLGGGSVYDETISLNGRATTTWFTYFFGRFRQVAQAAEFDLPPYTDAVITITVTRASGQARIGGIVIGRQIYLGTTLYEPEVTSESFSKITYDEFGASTLVRRRAVPQTTQRVRCVKALVDQVLQAKSDLDAVPALWAGIEDAEDGYFGALLILGVATTWTINLDQPDVALQTIELKEV